MSDGDGASAPHLIDETDLSPHLYTFSKVLKPETIDNEFMADPHTRVPLDPRYTEVIQDNLDWHQFVWSDSQLIVMKGIHGNPEEKIGEYYLNNFKLYDVRLNTLNS